MLRLTNMDIVLPLFFASHRLLCAMYWTFHVLRRRQVNVVVPLWLLCVMDWLFHVLRLSNMNVMFAPRTVLDVPGVATIKNECSSSIAFCIP